jgi:hypothetical protein
MNVEEVFMSRDLIVEMKKKRKKKRRKKRKIIFKKRKGRGKIKS